MRGSADFTLDEKIVTESLRPPAMDPNEDDDSGYVPIVEAAKRGNDDLINEYVEQGLNPKKLDALGNSALHWAAGGNHVDCIVLLLKLGLDPNQPNRDGDTPLHKAAWKNYEEAAAALVRSLRAHAH